VLRPMVGIILAAAILVFMLVPSFASLAPLSNSLEQRDFLGIAEAQDLVHDVSFLPEKVLQFGLAETGLDERVHFRVVSALFAMLAILATYSVLRLWHTKRIALLGTLLFATSSWLLHQARYADADVLYLTAVPLLLLVGTWLHDKRFDRLLPLSALIIGVCLYLPGLWLLILVSLIAFRSQLIEALREVNKKTRTLVVTTFLLSIAPLIYALATTPAQIASWLGVPDTALLSAHNVLENFYAIPKALFVTGPDTPIQWLVGTPVFDVFTIALIALGTYAYWVGQHPIRARVLAGFGLLALVLIGVGGPVTLSLLIPLMYIVAANGLALLLQQWFTVFPRNPFARILGVTCIVIALSVTVFYQLTRYYVAWPHATSTRKVIGTELQ
jgi:hypothetical protein